VFSLRKIGVCSKLLPKWKEPYIVVRKIDDLIYMVKRSPRQPAKVYHIDRLIPYKGRNPLISFLSLVIVSIITMNSFPDWKTVFSLCTNLVGSFPCMVSVCQYDTPLLVVLVVIGLITLGIQLNILFFFIKWIIGLRRCYSCRVNMRGAM
jgi:hypothetical protein